MRRQAIVLQCEGQHHTRDAGFGSKWEQTNYNKFSDLVLSKVENTDRFKYRDQPFCYLFVAMLRT